jgi:hypothetical protein
MVDYPNNSWDLFVSFVERIVNTSVNTSTNYEPARVIFGPGAAILPGVDKPTASTIAEWIELINLFQTHAVATHREVLQDKAAVIEAANQQSPPTTFQVGDLVWLVHETRSKKSLGIPRRKGPFTVLGCQNFSVTIADLVVSGSTRTVHISKLSPYVASSATSAVEERLSEATDVFVVESIVNHSFPRSTRKKPDGIHNMTVEVKWSGYAETSLEVLRSNPSLLKTSALLKYFRATPSLQHLIPQLPITAATAD